MLISLPLALFQRTSAQTKMFVQPRTGHHFRSSQYLGKSYVMVRVGSGLGSVMGLLEEKRRKVWMMGEKVEEYYECFPN